MKELGTIDAVHFVDLNPTVNSNHREYSGEIRRCNELMRSMRFFQSQLEKEKLIPDEPEVDLNYSITELTTQFENLETDLKQFIQSETELSQYRVELKEMQYVLTIGEAFLDKNLGGEQLSSSSTTEFGDPNVASSSTANDKMTTYQAEGRSSTMSFLAGVISQSRLENFFRNIYVAFRGNIIMQSETIPEDIPDSSTV